MSTRHLSDASQPAVNQLLSWAILLPQFLDRLSLLLVKDVLAFSWSGGTYMNARNMIKNKFVS